MVVPREVAEGPIEGGCEVSGGLAVDRGEVAGGFAKEARKVGEVAEVFARVAGGAVADSRTEVLSKVVGGEVSARARLQGRTSGVSRQVSLSDDWRAVCFLR